MPYKILIVDDAPHIVVPLQFLMEQRGYEVLVAASAEEAIEIIAKEEPDLILLDILLPRIDGYEVCQIIRLNPEWQDTRVIFLSARGREVDVARGMALGADDYITKPFSNADVLQRVAHLLADEYGQARQLLFA